MSFNTGLSGLNAASKNLNVTGNNIANVGSTGFKSSRAEFADIYATSMLGSGRNTTGSGVLTQAVAQQFTQGNITSTGNSLDLAINGNGFFVLSDGGSRAYTRNGTFHADRDGYIVDSSGSKLQGYGIDANGTVVNGVVTDLMVDTANQEPSATSTIRQTLALNSTATAPTVTTFDATNASTYNWSTSVDIYDSQGNSHTMSQYFVKNAADNSWTMYVTVDGRNPQDPTSTTPYSATVEFNASGALTNIDSTDFTVDATTNVMTMNNWTPAVQVNGVWGTNGAVANTDGIEIDLRGSTQTNTAFAVNSLTQDGYTTGQLSGLSISEDGSMFATYTNGQSKVIGQVILASFANMQGLTPVGNTNWVESFASGEPVIGTPGSGTLGSLESGSLEDSNVDLTAELVNLIVAQRNYQANAKTIETESTISQTIINIR